MRWPSAGHLSGNRNGRVHTYHVEHELGALSPRDVLDALDRRIVVRVENVDESGHGGNAKKLRKFPPACRAGDNANAFASVSFSHLESNDAVSRLASWLYCASPFRLASASFGENKVSGPSTTSTDITTNTTIGAMLSLIGRPK